MLMRSTSSGSGCGPGWAGKLILVFAAVLCSSQALAFQAQIRDVSATDFLQRSESIFRGRLISSESFVPAGGGTILTRHRFAVSRWVKGAGNRTIELIEYGGQVGQQTLSVSHQARYRSDQDYLVFSKVDGLGYRRTLGGPWGALPLISGNDGEAMVRLPGLHPLRNGLGAESAQLLLVKLDEFIGQLGNLMESLPHEAK